MPSGDRSSSAEPKTLGTGWIVEQRPVELLRALGDWAEVRGPIELKERFISEGVHRVVNGQVVEAIVLEQPVERFVNLPSGGES